jgi:hypothetical protein
MRRYNAGMQVNSTSASVATPSNVRYLEGSGWQVLIEAPYQWHTCRSEQDAYFIASGVLAANAVNAGVIGGSEVADELDAVATVAVVALGHAGAQLIIKAAARARA